jgi:hypothetical protein
MRTLRFPAKLVCTTLPLALGAAACSGVTAEPPSDAAVAEASVTDAGMDAGPGMPDGCIAQCGPAYPDSGCPGIVCTDNAFVCPPGCTIV